MMMTLQTASRRAAATLAFLALGACTNSGSLGNILGGVLGGGSEQSNQLSGTVQQVDTRSQQIYIQQSNGQSVALGYDNQTQVVYQNQKYAVTSLERGDQVTARLQSGNNGGYYTDLVQVDQSVSGSTGGTQNGGAVQTLQGIVRQIDTANGLFTLETGNNVLLTVSLPYRPSNADLNRFRSLRPGDNVRLQGVFLNNSRVELRQFY